MIKWWNNFETYSMKFFTNFILTQTVTWQKLSLGINKSQKEWWPNNVHLYVTIEWKKVDIVGGVNFCKLYMNITAVMVGELAVLNNF